MQHIESRGFYIPKNIEIARAEETNSFLPRQK